MEGDLLAVGKRRHRIRSGSLSYLASFHEGANRVGYNRFPKGPYCSIRVHDVAYDAIARGNGLLSGKFSLDSHTPVVLSRIMKRLRSSVANNLWTVLLGTPLRSAICVKDSTGSSCLKHKRMSRALSTVRTDSDISEAPRTT